MQQSDPQSVCTLCESPLPRHPIFESQYPFCCPGCHAVYNILSSSKQLASYRETPIFQNAVKAGIISNPDLILELDKTAKEQELHKIYLEIHEMWCPSCAEIIRYVLLREKGVYSCIVDYATDLAAIEFYPREISRDRIEQLISSFGYRPAPLQGSESRPVSSVLYLRLIIGSFLSLNLMMFAYPIYAIYFDGQPNEYSHLFAWLSFYASIPVIGYCGWPIFRRFINSLKTGIFGMETLVIIGVSSAFGLSIYELFTGGSLVYFDSMSVIIVFVLLGKVIEARAKFSAKDAVLRLTRAMPRRGRKRFLDGSELFVPLKDIVHNDHLVVLTGERIVLDGVVLEGEGTCDESVMTGEAWPLPKMKGDKVLAGTILQHGHLVVEVKATAEETALHKIIETVEHDIGHKTSYVRIADRIVRWFVPVALLIAITTGAVCLFVGITDPGSTALQTALLRAVSILLISCPCAIGIAAPLAESSLINALANKGVIVRNRGALYWLGRETRFIFDKTGTITEGKLTLISGTEILSKEQQNILKGLASQSTHPIAKAIAGSIVHSSVRIDEIEEFAGHGMRGYYNGDLYLMGSENFILHHGISLSKESFDPEGAISDVYFACNNKNLTILRLRDRIKKGANEIAEGLSPTPTFLLSGDGPKSVEYVARMCGFDGWEAQATPLRKREIVESFRKDGEVIAMLGDGINDAPALTSAHVGLAVVSAADISIQVSDILLTSDQFDMIPKIRLLAVKGRRIIYQNLFWAFIYNFIGLGLAIVGALTPLFAAFAMVASSLIVVVNAKRLGR